MLHLVLTHGLSSIGLEPTYEGLKLNSAAAAGPITPSMFGAYL